jgi:putative PIN family toxin of toxin-antitoxin system
MRAVLDTNILVSATLIRGGNDDRILRAWQRGAFELVLSPPILREIGRVFLYEKLQRYRWMSEEDVTVLLELLASESLLVPGKVAVKASRDPEDDKFLAAALEGKARYVVSGDKDLLDLKVYQNVRIITPAAFLQILRKAEKKSG